MLTDYIKAALAGENAPVSTEEITDRVLDMIPPDKLAEALREALPRVVVQVRNEHNRQLFHPDSMSISPSPSPHVSRNEFGSGAGSEAGSMSPGGVRTASARTAILLGDKLLGMTITGARKRTIKLGDARLGDLYAEIHSNEMRGRTCMTRAAIFRDMQAEMVENQLPTPAHLPAASRQQYASRMAKLLD